MFQQGEDLPLFSGVAQSVSVGEFDANKEEPKQDKLPGMPKLDWQELGNKWR